MAVNSEKTVRDHVYFTPPPDEGWKSLPDLPTPQEILTKQQDLEGLPPNPVDKPWSSKEEYLTAQYQILRREGIEGLRYSVTSYINSCSLGQDMDDDEHTCVYVGVYVRQYTLASIGAMAQIQFSTARSPLQIKWRQSRRLIPGTIVAISTMADNFKTICKIATIAQRPYRDGLDQDPPVIDLLWADPRDAVFDPDLEMVMIEARNGYFEATRHALIGLQHASQETSTIDKYLIGVHTADMTPQFLQQNPVVNLSSVAHTAPTDTHGGAERVEALIRHDVRAGIPDVGDITTLDDSQLAALHRIVSKELAIIQGPPGTGKTFTSIEAIKVMVATRKSNGGPPIIVSAQTNHALDQLLNLCLDFGARICRIGGRTESERVGDHTVYKIRQRTAAKPDGRFKALSHSRRDIVNRIRGLVTDLFGNQLVSPLALLQANIISQEQFDSINDPTTELSSDDELGPFSLWLGDERIPAEIVRNRYPTRTQLDEEAEKKEAEWEYEGDLENIAEDEEDKDKIRGEQIPLLHVWTGRDPPHLSSWVRTVRARLADCPDLFDIEPALRGAVYRHFQSRLLQALTPRFTKLLVEYDKIRKEIKADRWRKDIKLINNENIDIVGCTTTGLTKYRGLLAGLSPLSLLVEEASESREANIASAIYPSLQQLILVGDHQQLAPRCDVRWLGQEPYNLNVSLFQRMVNLEMPFVMLNQQRRMRPELSYFLQPFYPNLTNHASVLQEGARPDVLGMGGHNCWYFDHTWPEDTNSEGSKFNEQEALMVAKLCSYLVANGTPTDKITILTFYNGQRKTLRHKLGKEASLMGMNFKIHTVDSYQGEENDVVILSLVRSPVSDHAIGFLDDTRRAIVAMSRARRGFYAFGNLTNLLLAPKESRDTWVYFWNGFAEQGFAKRKQGLPLTCQNHNEVTWMKEVGDWDGISSGCTAACQEARPCGHKCTLKCHIVPHDRLPCSEPCRKVLKCGHGCLKYCGQACQCNCPEFKAALKQAEMVQHAKVAKEKTLEEHLCEAMPLAPAFLKAAMGRVQLVAPNGRVQPVYAESNGATQTPATSISEHSGSSPEKWKDYTTNIQQHDQRLYRENLQSLSKSAKDSPSQMRIADTYKSTAVVNGRRAHGTRSTRQLEVSLPKEKGQSQSPASRRSHQVQRRGKHANGGVGVARTASTPRAVTLADVGELDLLTGTEAGDSIDCSLTSCPPLNPKDPDDLLIDFKDFSM